jgi:hypothetical protein
LLADGKIIPEGFSTANLVVAATVGTTRGAACFLTTGLGGGDFLVAMIVRETAGAVERGGGADLVEIGMEGAVLCIIWV